MTSPDAAQCPASVTIIGWLAVGLGALSTLSAAGALVVTTAMPPMTDFPARPGGYFPTWIFEHMQAIAGAQMVVAALAIVTGVAFLRLRPWSRPVMEILCWASLAFLLAYAVVWVRTASSMKTAMGGQTQVQFPMGVFTAAGVLMMLVFAIPNIIVIRTLRSRVVRQVFGATMT